jgi:hypothetical protein
MTPVVLRVMSDRIVVAPEVIGLIEQTRRDADAFVFLSGGASKMDGGIQRRLLELFGALTLLADRGNRLAVGDGGTQAGIMQAAGLARRASRRPFPLIGVAPAPELSIAGSAGRTPIDPNHTAIVAVDNPRWIADKQSSGWTPEQGHWGSETGAMYALFDRLSEGRPSIAIVANGGHIVLDEVRANVSAGRGMVLIAGSGRATDALVGQLRGTPPADAEAARLSERIAALELTKHDELYRIFDLNEGPTALADLLEGLLPRS